MQQWFCNQEDHKVTEVVGFCYSYVALKMYNVEFSCMSCMLNMNFSKVVVIIFKFLNLLIFCMSFTPKSNILILDTLPHYNCLWFNTLHLRLRGTKWFYFFIFIFILSCSINLGCFTLLQVFITWRFYIDQPRKVPTCVSWATEIYDHKHCLDSLIGKTSLLYFIKTFNQLWYTVKTKSIT